MKISKKLILISAAILLLAAGCGKHQAQTNQPSTLDASPASKAAKITVNESVEGSSINKASYQVAEGKSALDLLEASHLVETKSFGSMGSFVSSIDGQKPDSKHFWEFFVNGKSSNVGASSYILKDGDKIEWKLSVISANGE
jgi:ABC-type enterochelin transport system substrate-binding protein